MNGELVTHQCGACPQTAEAPEGQLPEGWERVKGTDKEVCQVCALTPNQLPAGGVVLFACRRGDSPGFRCKCGRGGIKQCDYPVTRAGKAGTCDAHLCDRCAVLVGPGRHYCGPHHRYVERRGERCVDPGGIVRAGGG